MGRKAGGRGAAWGAALGTLPDLDILAYPFLDAVGQLAFHRGFTHSIAFVFLVTPLVGALLERIHRKQGVPRKQWMLMTFLVVGTHIFLDCFTVYGTQVFQPFSDYPVAWSSLFIIDPLYTVPLALGVIVALFMKRGSVHRRRANRLGLLLSTLYVVWSLVAKTMAGSAFEAHWAALGLEPERTMSNAMPLNTILWMGLAEQDDTIHVAVHSLLDDGPPSPVRHIPKQSQLLEGVEGNRAVHRLLRFSKGWYAVQRRGDNLIFDDLRFGRGDAWLTDSGTPIFRFQLLEGDCPDEWCSFRQLPGQLGSLEALKSRALGNQ